MSSSAPTCTSPLRDHPLKDVRAYRFNREFAAAREQGGRGSVGFEMDKTPTSGHTMMELPVTNPSAAHLSWQGSSVEEAMSDLKWMRRPCQGQTVTDLPVTYSLGRTPIVAR